jgi:DNA-binding MarR family transcriptional regulator
MLKAWRSKIPDALRELDPVPVLGILKLSSREGGIFLGELSHEIGVNQSWTTKLVAKLRDAKLITSKTPEHDSRRSLITITAKGRKLLADLDMNLKGNVSGQTGRPRRRARSGVIDAEGQQRFDLEKYIDS